MIRPPSTTTRTDPRFPYTTLFRSVAAAKSLSLAAAFPPTSPVPVRHAPARGFPPSPDRRRRDFRRGSTPRPQEPAGRRSEEHTSELQSLMRISYAVFCLKKKQTQNTTRTNKAQPIKITRQPE